MSAVRRLRTVVENEQLKTTVSVKTCDSQDLSYTTAKQFLCLRRHEPLNVRRNPKHSNRVSDLDARLIHDV